MSNILTDHSRKFLTRCRSPQRRTLTFSTWQTGSWQLTGSCYGFAPGYVDKVFPTITCTYTVHRWFAAGILTVWDVVGTICDEVSITCMDFSEIKQHCPPSTIPRQKVLIKLSGSAFWLVWRLMYGWTSGFISAWLYSAQTPLPTHFCRSDYSYSTQVY